MASKYQLDVKRHSMEHVMVLAIKRLFDENIKLGVGPVVENGFYQDIDYTFKEEDLPKIEKEMKEIIQEGIPFEYEEVEIDDALEYFTKQGQQYKVELLEDLKKKGTTKTSNAEETEEVKHLLTKNKVTFYTIGIHKDLCRGPHVANTKDLNGMGFMLDKIAGAYWRGNEKNPTLTRIYGVAFSSSKELKQFISNREEAEKRNHRKIGQEMELFANFDAIGQGLPVWLPNGYAIRRVLEDYMMTLERKFGYQHILTPHINKKQLFETSGHLQFYKDSMYSPVEIDDETYYLKPMNCPAGMQVYSMKPRSYKELPLKLGEFGTVYRYEKSGELHGLQRVRGFTQNDAHLFVTPEQLEDLFTEVFSMMQIFYKDIGFSEFKYRLSLRSDEKNKYVGHIEDWKQAEDTIRKVLKKLQIAFYEAEGEAAFYGPKLDVQAVNVFGKEDTISTIQVDFNLPEKFNLKYVDSNGKEKRPFVIHRALIGSFERFFAFLIEYYGGKFPLWFAPQQIRILPVSEKFNDYAKQVEQKLLETGEELNMWIRVEVDEREETLQAKIRDAEKEKVFYSLVVGEKEQVADSVAVRSRGKGNQGIQKTEDFISQFIEQVKSKIVDI